MSAKKVKVKKLIKEQRRARQKAIREQERAATQKAKADAAAARAEWKAEEQRLRREQEAQQQPEKKRSAAPEATPAGAEEPAAPAAVRSSELSAVPAVDATPAPSAAVPEQREPMSHSRRERRDQRKHDRTQRGRNDAASPASSANGNSTASGSSTAKGAGARTGALVVTAGVVAAMVGSVVLDGLIDGRSAAATDQGATAALGAASVAAPQTGQSFICPPMPGRPDSLTTDGQLEYNDRDSSATSRFSAVLFATDLRGSYPDSSWAQLNQESLINDITLTEAEGAEDGNAGTEIDGADSAAEASEPAPLIEREATFVSADNSVRPPLLNTDASPDGGPVAAAGLYEYQAESGPVTGLAVGECTAPERNQWFFGPEVAAGSTSLLTLANPYDRPATVEVTSVDSEGDRGATGSRSVVVPGETTRSVNIAGIASAGAEMGVSVRSSGAPVTAQLQSSRAAGLTGTGVEFLPGMTEAGTSHLLPGVPVAEGIPDAEDQDSEDDAGQSEPTPPELWIHVPGDQGATVELQVYGENGQQSIDTPGVFTVDGGEVDVINLQGLEAGISDIRVNTDVPAYVSVRSEAASGADFSWAAPTQPLAEGSGALLPEFGETELRLFATGSAGSIAYRVMDTEGEFGEEQTVELAADGAAVITAEDLVSADAAGQEGDIEEGEGQDGEAEPAVVVFADPEFNGEGSVHATMATTDGEDHVSLTAVSPLRGAEQYVPVRLLR